MRYFVKAIRLPLYRTSGEQDVTRYANLKPGQRISHVVSATPPLAQDSEIELWAVIEEDDSITTTDLPVAPIVEIREAC